MYDIDLGYANLHSKNETSVFKLFLTYMGVKIKQRYYVLNYFSRPKYSHIVQKVSARAFH